MTSPSATGAEAGRPDLARLLGAPAVGDLAFVDTQQEPTIGANAYPRLVEDRGSIGAVIGQWHEVPLSAFHALG
ncbi:MAG: hypothetical protein ACI8TX_000428 [Hyphomicrobiaceae bacterium]|jgi:hypothetical protein